MTRWSVLILLSLTQSAMGVDGPLPAPTSPPGLDVVLKTAANKTTFYLSEIVPLEVVFRAAKPATYAIEIADGWNGAPAADRFLVEPSHEVIDRRRWLYGISCCDSRRPFIPAVSTVYQHELTDFLRFTRPGEYRIQYTTRRVFNGSAAPKYEPSTLLIRSNVVTLRVIEDEPAWLENTLEAALLGVDPVPPIGELQALLKLPARGSVERPRLSDRMARYTRASRLLRQLDTPEAIRERVARVRMPTVEEWRGAERGGGYIGIDNAVACSSRPDLVAVALRERASAPGFGVMRGYFELWVGVLMERDSPEAYRLSRYGDKRDLSEAAEVYSAKGRDVLELLRQVNVTKTGVAAEITAATIRSVERSLTK